MVHECISEPGESQQRAAARSAVAAAMARWGCRVEPRRWNWAHLREPLERYLRQSRVRYLGDAWMLAALVVSNGGGGGDGSGGGSGGSYKATQWLADGSGSGAGDAGVGGVFTSDVGDGAGGGGGGRGGDDDGGGGDVGRAVTALTATRSRQRCGRRRL